MQATVSAPPPAQAAAASRVQLALLVLRVVVGVVFAVHGAQKLFAIGLGGVIGFFTKAGIPLPAVAGPVVTFVELLGGLALALGVATRPAAILIALDMLGAIVFVHLKAGFFAPAGFEYPLTMLAAAASLALSGAGAYSIDAALARRARAG